MIANMFVVNLPIYPENDLCEVSQPLYFAYLPTKENVIRYLDEIIEEYAKYTPANGPGLHWWKEARTVLNASDDLNDWDEYWMNEKKMPITINRDDGRVVQTNIKFEKRFISK